MRNTVLLFKRQSRLFLAGIFVLVCTLTDRVLAELQAQPAAVPYAIHSIEAHGITNVFQLSSNVFSGSAPEGADGFTALKELGVTTIISVDGTFPEVDLAHKAGLRYVHLPHGYDGIDVATQAKLIKAARTASGAVYVHCHHGQHRGPAAAAVICMANDHWPIAVGLDWLHQAGTSSNYTGLFATIRNFHEPTAAELSALPAAFPEVAKVDDLVDAMVKIDQTWDRLKELQKSGFKAPDAHFDLSAKNELLILLEHFREAQRLPSARERGAPFLSRLKSAEDDAAAAWNLAARIEVPGEKDLKNSLAKIGTSCRDCHKAFRDKPLKP